MRIDHVGVVTRDANALAALYGDLFGARVAHEESLGDIDIRFLDLGNGFIELLEPDSESTLTRFLDRHGPGMHHLAVETTDIEVELEAARSMGVSLIDEEPRPGAWGHTIAFLHPDSTGGVLVEFVEH